MYDKVFLLRNNERYFGCSGMKRTAIFAFRRRRQIEHVERHIKYEDIMVEKLSPNRYLLKSHFNEQNNIKSNRLAAVDIVEGRLHNLLLEFGANNIDLRLVESITDRDDGDIDLVARELKNQIRLDDDIIRHNLEMLINL